MELMGASGGGPPLRCHRGCCRPGIGDVSLTTPQHRRTSSLLSPSARRTTSPFPSILHLLRHGDPFQGSRGMLCAQTCAAIAMLEPRSRTRERAVPQLPPRAQPCIEPT